MLVDLIMEQLCRILFLEHKLDLLVTFQVLNIPPMCIQHITINTDITHHQDNIGCVRLQFFGGKVAGVIRVVHAWLNKLTGLIGINTNRNNFRVRQANPHKQVFFI